MVSVENSNKANRGAAGGEKKYSHTKPSLETQVPYSYVASSPPSRMGQDTIIHFPLSDWVFLEVLFCLGNGEALFLAREKNRSIAY